MERRIRCGHTPHVRTSSDRRKALLVRGRSGAAVVEGNRVRKDVVCVSNLIPVLSNRLRVGDAGAEVADIALPRDGATDVACLAECAHANSLVL